MSKCLGAASATRQHTIVASDTDDEIAFTPNALDCRPVKAPLLKCQPHVIAFRRVFHQLYQACPNSFILASRSSSVP